MSQTASSAVPGAELQAASELLLVSAHRFGLALDEALRGRAVSTMGLVALCMISAARRPMTVKALAARLGSSRQSAGEIVGRLVRDGLVGRAIDDRDKRVCLLTPTERGLRLEEWARYERADCMASYMRSFSDRDMTTFVDLLQRVEQAAEAHRRERLWGIRPRRAGDQPRRPRRPAPVHLR